MFKIENNFVQKKRISLSWKLTFISKKTFSVIILKKILLNMSGYLNTFLVTKRWKLLTVG